MPRPPFRFILALAVGLPVALSGVLTVAAQAQPSAKATVDAAKASGVVGEQSDGYLAIVAGGDAEIRGAVAQINAGRAGAYREAGEAAGTTPVAAGEAAYRQLLTRMPSGYFYKPPQGGWTRK